MKVILSNKLEAKKLDFGYPSTKPKPIGWTQPISHTINIKTMKEVGQLAHV
jgi:hypothetical protein